MKPNDVIPTITTIPTRGGPKIIVPAGVCDYLNFNPNNPNPNNDNPNPNHSNKETTMTEETSDIQRVELNLIPLGDRIIIQPIEEASQRDSGVIIPDIAKGLPGKGTVLATGEKVTLLSTGDIVLFGRYSATEIADENIKYLMLKEGEVIAKVKKAVKE